jgi:uncharacterized protein (UPF0548 family)
MECGVARFFLRRRSAVDISFNIESWSRPGNWLATLGRPFARLAQKGFTTEALSNFVHQVVEATEPVGDS